MKPDFVVTRHVALVEYLKEEGVVEKDVEVVPHAFSDQLIGRHVCGVLPIALAAFADAITVIPLSIPPELRGQDLSIEQVREFAHPPRTFIVKEIT